MKRPSEVLNAIGPAWFWREAHAVLAVLWFINIPVAIFTPLKESISYLIIVSLMTAVSGEMAGMHASVMDEDDCDT